MFTNFFHNTHVKDRRTHVSALRVLGRMHKWTGRRLFERMKKEDILQEINSPFVERVRTKAESLWTVALYQATLKKQWDGLLGTERMLWEKLADEMNEPIQDRDDDDLLICQ